MHASLEHSSMAGALPSDDFGDDLIAEVKHLRAFAVSLSGSASASDDLLQETLLRAWSKSTQFRDGTNLRAWLLTILRNIFYSSLRKRVREVQDSDGVYARCLTVSGGQEGHLDLQDFRRALAKLPEKQREVLILVGASGHTYEEAAAICEVEIGTIKSRLSRGRSKLSSFSPCRTLSSLPISTHARPATLAGSKV
jgi:RNA polymerase sigma-70 factor, ECF subfamily